MPPGVVGAPTGNDRPGTPDPKEHTMGNYTVWTIVGVLLAIALVIWILQVA